MPTKPVEIPDIEAKPLKDSRGFAVLFDLYVAGKWVGSRRTAEQCEDYLTYLLGVPITAYWGSPW